MKAISLIVGIIIGLIIGSAVASETVKKDYETMYNQCMIEKTLLTQYTADCMLDDDKPLPFNPI